MFMHHHHDWGLLSLAAALVFISLLCAIQPGRTARVVYPAGEIAAHDVVSDRDLLVEDPQATQLRRDRALVLQCGRDRLCKRGPARLLHHLPPL